MQQSYSWLDPLQKSGKFSQQVCWSTHTSHSADTQLKKKNEEPLAFRTRQGRKKKDDWLDQQRKNKATTTHQFSFAPQEIKMLLFSIVLVLPVISADELRISMPHSRPSRPETYLCTSMRLNRTDSSAFVTGFEAEADGRVAHHLIVFGCKTPGEHHVLLQTYV